MRRIGWTAVLLAPGMVVVALACRDDAEPPTAPEPAHEVAATHALAFREVTAGVQHTCGLTTSGVAYCWGALTGGRTPVRVVGGLTFTQINAGDFHTCGVTDGNRAYCWGLNGTGQLGDGTETDSPRPVRVAPRLAFSQVSAGDLHSCGVTTNHVAYCWGHNQAGPLGDGTTNGSTKPVRVARGLAFRQISAGDQFTCGVTTNDVAFCWGMNSSGQLGVGSDTGPESCFTGDGFQSCSTRPVRVLRGLAFREVSVGDDHACGVTTDDVAYCWGGNGGGQLGHRTTELCFKNIIPCSMRPIPVARALPFREVTSGGQHTCGVTTDDIAYCWGLNSFGGLGIGNAKQETCSFLDAPVPCTFRPARVVGGLAFRQVSAEGGSHECGVSTVHIAYCWGDNSSGQLGDGTTRTRLRPHRVAAGN
jgi:alpha-tubulin suppressor-like RCC1 family protein